MSFSLENVAIDSENNSMLAFSFPTFIFGAAVTAFWTDCSVSWMSGTFNFLVSCTRLSIESFKLFSALLLHSIVDARVPFNMLMASIVLSVPKTKEKTETI